MNDNSKTDIPLREKIKRGIKQFFSHQNLRQIAITLNHFNLVEIGVILFFGFLSYEAIYFIMDSHNIGKPVSEWFALSVLGPMVGGIFSMATRFTSIHKEEDK